MAESIVGDITPLCGVSKEEKQRRELAAMREISSLIPPQGEHLMELFEVRYLVCEWINFVYFFHRSDLNVIPSLLSLDSVIGFFPQKNGE